MNKLVNFRDLGGLAAADGKKVRPRRLLRADAPVGLAPEEIEMLKNHGITLIIDFRSQMEVETEPADQIDGVEYVNLDVMADRMSHWSNPQEWMTKLRADTAEADMAANYKEFIQIASSKIGFAEFLRHCADKQEGAIFFHCAAGKDRTGFGAAIILKILGVSDEDIYADYMKTAEERKEANLQIIDNYRAMGLNEDQLAALTTMYGVKQEYLAASFAAIEEEYGSFENFVRDGLGISDEHVACIREFYLE